jgi:hypothetical protein
MAIRKFSDWAAATGRTATDHAAHLHVRTRAEIGREERARREADMDEVEEFFRRHLEAELRRSTVMNDRRLLARRCSPTTALSPAVIATAGLSAARIGLMRFTPDPDFEQNLQGSAQPALDRFQRSVDRIVEERAGWSEAEILAELMAAAREAGIAPDDAEMAKLALEISNTPDQGP